MISYLVTVCNEYKELEGLLSQLHALLQNTEEVVVLHDTSNTVPEVGECIEAWSPKFAEKFITFTHVRSNLNGDFAAFKNYGNSHCTKPWIFQIDADEQILHPVFIKDLHQMLSSAADFQGEGIDVVLIGRVNTVFGITLQHCRGWKWKISTIPGLESECEYDDLPDGYRDLLQYHNLILREKEGVVYYKVPVINFPDYQTRIYRNTPAIKWEGKVHERIIGGKSLYRLPAESVYCLLHRKEIERQEQQNMFYNTL